MSDPTPSGPRPFSPLWALLLLPVGLLAGWLIGRIPGSDAPAPAAAPARSTAVRAAAAAPAPASFDARSESASPAEPAEAPAEAPAAIVSDWTSMSRALEESRRNGKPILIDFNAEWCGPCQRLKAELFDDWTKGRAVQTAVIPVSIVDRNREEGRNPPEIEELQQRYDVRAFPTLVVFSPQSGRVVQTRGYGDPDRTLQWIEQAARSVTP